MIVMPGWVRTTWFDKFVGVKRNKKICRGHIFPLNGFAVDGKPRVLSEARMAET